MIFQPLPKDVIEKILQYVKFDDDGLIPAIAQQYDTSEILMMAWMNEKSLKETLLTGRVCYFSRSRGKIWRKGESSGQMQTLMDAFIDCDGDTILLKINQKGVACHTGRRSCFYRELTPKGLQSISKPLIDPKTLYKNT